MHRNRLIFTLWIFASFTLLAGCSIAGNDTEPTPGATTGPRDEIPEGEPLYIVERGGISTSGPISQAGPGDTLELAVGHMQCCTFYEPLNLEAAWSVEPSDAATIDGAGTLSVGGDVPPSTVITVTAELADGQVVTQPITIYTSDANPLVGYWVEDVQFACSTGDEIVPQETIAELVLEADGSFSVTWFPFEVYKDYWGHYTFDMGTGVLKMEVESGNWVPPYIDGDGTFHIDEQGRLVLDSIWLGFPSTGYGASTPGPEVANCGHRFVSR